MRCNFFRDSGNVIAFSMLKIWKEINFMDNKTELEKVKAEIESKQVLSHYNKLTDIGNIAKIKMWNCANEYDEVYKDKS